MVTRLSSLFWVGILALLITSSGASADDCGNTKKYNGAWFNISYPADFTPRASLPSYSAKGHDSVFFTSPDKLVTFYVYAPQWGGVASDIAQDPDTETLSAERDSTKGSLHHHWWTVESKKGTYSRAYHSVSASDGSSVVVVGIRYRDDQALASYRAQYIAFKDSLQQFSD